MGKWETLLEGLHPTALPVCPNGTVKSLLARKRTAILPLQKSDLPFLDPLPILHQDNVSQMEWIMPLQSLCLPHLQRHQPIGHEKQMLVGVHLPASPEIPSMVVLNLEYTKLDDSSLESPDHLAMCTHTIWSLIQ